MCNAISKKDSVLAFFRKVIDNYGKTAYGPGQVKENLKIDAVKLLLISEDSLVTADFTTLIARSDANVVFVPTTFDEGVQLKNVFGGIAAILK